MEFNKETAQQFIIDCQLVTLDDLLECAGPLGDRFGLLSNSYEDQLTAWRTSAPRSDCSGYTKDQLLGMLKELGWHTNSTASKDHVLAQVLRRQWEQTETFQTFRSVRHAHTQLQEWAEELRRLPKKLQQVVYEADEFFCAFTKRSTTLHTLASSLRWDAGTIMTASLTSKMASDALATIEKGEALAAVIRKLTASCIDTLRGVVFQNLAPTASGLYAAGELQSAKAMVRVIRPMLPKAQREIFLTY